MSKLICMLSLSTIIVMTGTLAAQCPDTDSMLPHFVGRVTCCTAWYGTSSGMNKCRDCWSCKQIRGVCYDCKNHYNECKPTAHGAIAVPCLPILDEGPFQFGLIEATETSSGRKVLIAATEDDYRRSESMRLRISKDEVVLTSCSLGIGGNYCIGGCPNDGTFRYCKLHGSFGHYYCSCF
ncbi:hypothetical protein Rcae01_03477 [Novipirellula caenicola]|uniref:Uncharacterized protein n=1 Tax=Novipirellula caenicola TaxID=1536901 RepID=A0ABP9VS81_9BACT